MADQQQRYTPYRGWEIVRLEIDPLRRLAHRWRGKREGIAVTAASRDALLDMIDVRVRAQSK